MKWTDILLIAEELNEEFPETNPQHLNFVDLYHKILNLKKFDDHPNHSNERILEAIQSAWINERQ